MSDQKSITKKRKSYFPILIPSNKKTKIEDNEKEEQESPSLPKKEENDFELGEDDCTEYNFPFKIVRKIPESVDKFLVSLHYHSSDPREVSHHVMGFKRPFDEKALAIYSLCELFRVRDLKVDFDLHKYSEELGSVTEALYVIILTCYLRGDISLAEDFVFLYENELGIQDSCDDIDSDGYEEYKALLNENITKRYIPKIFRPLDGWLKDTFSGTEDKNILTKPEFLKNIFELAATYGPDISNTQFLSLNSCFVEKQ